MGRHRPVKLLYTQLLVSKWLGFPACSACLCGECGFMFVKLRLGGEDQSLTKPEGSESPTVETICKQS